jgi:hypothetical protein
VNALMRDGELHGFTATPDVTDVTENVWDVGGNVGRSIICWKTARSKAIITFGRSDKYVGTHGLERSD